MILNADLLLYEGGPDITMLLQTGIFSTPERNKSHHIVQCEITYAKISRLQPVILVYADHKRLVS